MEYSKEELEEMTVAELRELAKNEEITLGGDATTKAEIIAKLLEGPVEPEPVAPSMEGLGRRLDLEAFGGKVPWDDPGPANTEYDLRADELKGVSVGGFTLGPGGWEPPKDD